jgi:Tfp pilus assembly protein FimT
MTLIELILVMGLLVTMLALAAPSLSRFFAGRRSSEEGRRLLALTVAARAEAISQATPQELWVDPQEGAYGMRPQQEADAADAAGRPPRTYRLADGLTLEVDKNQLNDQGQAVILFLPDGTIDDTSVALIGIQEDSEREIVLERLEVGVGYSIR